MFCSRRVDDFNGSVEEYIEYLENQVHLGRHQIHRLQSVLGPPTPANSPVSTSVSQLVNLPDSTVGVTLGSNEKCLEDQQKSNGEIKWKEWKFIHAVTKEIAKEISPCQKPHWLVELDAMLADIPYANLWKSKRTENQISGLAQNHSVLATLLGGALVLDHSAGSAVSINSSSPANTLSILHNRANAYGYATRNTQSKAQFTTTVSVFQELIFVSFCVVLEASGMPNDSVDSLMRWCFAANEQKSLERIRRGARWANRCIARLCEGGWGHRSAEIFLLCGRRVPVYGRFSDSAKKSFSHFCNTLVGSRYIEPQKEDDEWLPYHIPCIIKLLVCDALTLQQICEALGYAESSLATFSKVHEVYERVFRSEINTSCSVIVPQKGTPIGYSSDPQSKNDDRRGKIKKKNLPTSDRVVKRGNGALRKTVTRTEKSSRSIPQGPKIFTKELQCETLKQNDGGGWCRHSSTAIDQPQDISVALRAQESPDDELGLSVEASVSSDPPAGTGFDIESMGFDMAAYMELGLDMSATMETAGFDIAAIMQAGLYVPGNGTPNQNPQG